LFFFCDLLTWDDILDWHNGILLVILKNQRTNPSPVYHSLRSGTRPQMGRSPDLLTPKLSLETQHAII
jgi:hypothetical protein